MGTMILFVESDKLCLKHWREGLRFPVFKKCKVSPLNRRPQVMHHWPLQPESCLDKTGPGEDLFLLQ